MATRNSYLPDVPDDPTQDPSYVDPTLVMSTPLPSVPATPAAPTPQAQQKDQAPPYVPPNAPVPPLSSSQQPAATTDSGGIAYTTPTYVPPPPGPNASAPRPSVDPSIIYTDSSGNGYDPPALKAAWDAGKFAGDPTAARIPDLLAQYGYGGAAAPAPAGGGNGGGSGSTFQLSAPNFSSSAGFSLPESQLGDAVSSKLQDLISGNGMTPDQRSLLDTVNGIILHGGALPEDTDIEQQQLESAREDENAAFSSQLNDARSELASRGLVSEPGIPQGAETDAISTITRNLAPAYSQAVQGIKTTQMQQQEARLQSAISTATGLDNTAASNLLASLGQGTSRQVGLAQIALDSLAQDTQWNEFLATYGLNRDQLLYTIQQGNIAPLMTLLNLFTGVAGISQGGHI